MILIYITICLIVFLLLWFCLFSYMINPFRLNLVYGQKGSGKTTYKIWLARRYLKKGYNVYCDEPVPGCFVHDPSRDIGSYKYEPKSLILCDEAAMIWDNRDFKNFKKEVRNFIALQRHNRLIVYVFSQTDAIDNRFRNNADNLYQLKNFALAFICVRKIKRTIAPASYFRNSNFSIFNTEINNSMNNAAVSSSSTALIDYYEYASIFEPGGFRLIFIPFLHGLYDSYDTSYDNWYDKKREDKLQFIDMTENDIKSLNYSLFDNLKRFFIFEYNRFLNFLSIVKIKIMKFYISLKKKYKK